MSAIPSQIVSVLRSHKLVGHLVSWYLDSTSGNILQGFVRGFIIYFIPFTLLKRKLKLETLQRGIAVGSFTGVFRALYAYLSSDKGAQFLQNLTKTLQLDGHQENLKKAIAGAVGASVLVGVDKSLVNSIFVLWCLVRALPFVLPHVPYGSVLVMCLAATQIAVTWVKRPLLMDQGYRRFLISQGGKPANVLELLGTENFPARHFCAINHPGQTCVQHGISYWSGGFVRALKLYLPLYVVFFVMTKRRSVKNSLIGLLRSSVFLTSYCSASWVALCVLLSKYAAKPNSAVTSTALFVRLWLSGIPVLLERPSRRSELAQYCATYALDTVYRYYEHHRFVKPNYLVGVLFTAFAWSILLWNSDAQPKFLSQWLFGIRSAEQKKLHVVRQSDDAELELEVE